MVTSDGVLVPDSAKAISSSSIPAARPGRDDRNIGVVDGMNYVMDVATWPRHRGLVSDRAQVLDALEALAWRLVMRSWVGLVPAPIVNPVTAGTR